MFRCSRGIRGYKLYLAALGVLVSGLVLLLSTVLQYSYTQTHTKSPHSYNQQCATIIKNYTDSIIDLTTVPSNSRSTVGPLQLLLQQGFSFYPAIIRESSCSAANTHNKYSQMCVQCGLVICKKGDRCTRVEQRTCPQPTHFTLFSSYSFELFQFWASSSD